MTIEEIDTMAHAYLECALFATSDYAELDMEETPGEFPSHLYMDRWSDDERAKALDRCRQFYTENADDLSDYPANCAGYDLWFTENGHGCGFWEADHCTQEQGDRLTTKIRKCSRDVYIGADDKYYIRDME
jgi:hypothetical protein